MKTKHKKICNGCGPKPVGINEYDICEFEVEYLTLSTYKEISANISTMKMIGIVLSSQVKGYYKVLLINDEKDNIGNIIGYEIDRECLIKESLVRAYKKLDKGILLFCKNIERASIFEKIAENLYPAEA